ncbi:MAG: hypothetical protein LLG14_25935 [Nocardiaceae bacterium]|nr:hypothetical protein [Nocardiaceae bacterium]
MTTTTTPDRHRTSIDFRRPGAVWVLLAVTAIFFAYSLTTIRDAKATQYGLLFAASPLLWIAIVLSGISFVVATRLSDGKAATAAIGLSIIAQRLPGSLSTDVPMYAWTYKHIGVVDSIQHAHLFARDVDIYNGWPGLFVVTAWFSDTTGIPETSLAHWFTPVFYVLFALAIYAVARAWGLEQRYALTAVFLAVNLNWVGQDYFSPQATALLLTCGVLALMGLARSKPVGVSLLILIFTGLTITHQLTPYWLLLAIFLLVVTKQAKPVWIIFPLGAILVVWLAYNFGQVSHFTLFSFDVTQNAKSNIATTGSTGQRLQSAGVRVLSVAVWGLTALTIFWRYRQKQEWIPFAILAFSPMMILGGQSYGGEAIFRVFLYSLIGCSIVLAVPLTNLVSQNAKRLALAATATAVALTLSAEGYFGAWFANAIPKIQVEESNEVLNEMPYPAYLTIAAPTWPERTSWRYVPYARFNRYYDDSLIFVTGLVGAEFESEDEYRRFMDRIYARFDAPTYLLFTRQMQFYAEYYGILPPNALLNLRSWIDKDKKNWTLVHDKNGLAVYVFKPSSTTTFVPKKK